MLAYLQNHQTLAYLVFTALLNLLLGGAEQKYPRLVPLFKALGLDLSSAFKAVLTKSQSPANDNMIPPPPKVPSDMKGDLN